MRASPGFTLLLKLVPYDADAEVAAAAQVAEAAAAWAGGSTGGGGAANPHAPLLAALLRRRVAEAPDATSHKRLWRQIAERCLPYLLAAAEGNSGVNGEGEGRKQRQTAEEILAEMRRPVGGNGGGGARAAVAAAAAWAAGWVERLGAFVAAAVAAEARPGAGVGAAAAAAERSRALRAVARDAEAAGPESAMWAAMEVRGGCLSSTGRGVQASCSAVPYSRIGLNACPGVTVKAGLVSRLSTWCRRALTTANNKASPLMGRTSTPRDCRRRRLWLLRVARRFVNPQTSQHPQRPEPCPFPLKRVAFGGALPYGQTGLSACTDITVDAGHEPMSRVSS